MTTAGQDFAVQQGGAGSATGSTPGRIGAGVVVAVERVAGGTEDEVLRGDVTLGTVEGVGDVGTVGAFAIPLDAGPLDAGRLDAVGSVAVPAAEDPVVTTAAVEPLGEATGDWAADQVPSADGVGELPVDPALVADVGAEAGTEATDAAVGVPDADDEQPAIPSATDSTRAESTAEERRPDISTTLSARIIAVPVTRPQRTPESPPNTTACPALPPPTARPRVARRPVP